MSEFSDHRPEEISSGSGSELQNKPSDELKSQNDSELQQPESDNKGAEEAALESKPEETVSSEGEKEEKPGGISGATEISGANGDDPSLENNTVQNLNGSPLNPETGSTEVQTGTGRVDVPNTEEQTEFLDAYPLSSQKTEGAENQSVLTPEEKEPVAEPVAEEVKPEEQKNENVETPTELTGEKKEPVAEPVAEEVKPEDAPVAENGDANSEHDLYDPEKKGYELPEGCKYVDPDDIDMSEAMGMDDPNFWNHHGNTKEDYMDLAGKLPEVQERLKNGESLEDLYNDPDVGATAYQYYDPDKMVKVYERPDGSYEFDSDGRHRVAAAQELGYDIPVKVEKTDDVPGVGSTEVSTGSGLIDDPNVGEQSKLSGVDVEQGESQLDNAGPPPEKIKCRNEELEGQEHPQTGVPFVRKQVEVDGNIYEVVVPEFDSAFDAKLPENMYKESDRVQFEECNSQLKSEIATNKDLREQFDEEQIEQIENGETPDGYTWHHDAEAGKMQLVDTETHQKTGHTGGRSIWGGGTDNR